MKITPLYSLGIALKFNWDCQECGRFNTIQVDNYENPKTSNMDGVGDLKLEDLGKRKITIQCARCKAERKALVSLKVEEYPFRNKRRTAKLKEIEKQWKEKQRVAYNKNRKKYIESLKRDKKGKKR